MERRCNYYPADPTYTNVVHVIDIEPTGPIACISVGL
jgi:hypothetical protein